MDERGNVLLLIELPKKALAGFFFLLQAIGYDLKQTCEQYFDDEENCSCMCV